MELCEIKYVYGQTEEAHLESFLASLQERLGGQRTPYFARGGAVDIVSLLELLVVFTAGISIKPVLQKYFEGLLNADGMKALGEKHRKEVTDWFHVLEKDLADIVSSIHLSLGLLHTSLTYDGNEEAIVLEIPTYSGPLYVVLNHKELTPQLVKNLPKGIITAVQFLCENSFPDKAVAFQLYFETKSHQWVYLFAPTVNGFGDYINRYVDLRDAEIRHLASQSAFIHMFDPAPEDSLKFLVSPFKK